MTIEWILVIFLLPNSVVVVSSFNINIMNYKYIQNSMKEYRFEKDFVKIELVRITDFPAASSLRGDIKIHTSSKCI